MNEVVVEGRWVTLEKHKIDGQIWIINIVCVSSENLISRDQQL